MREKYPFFTKIGIVALLALFIVPAGVMAAGFHGSGSGKLAASTNGQQLAENSIVPGEQFSFSSPAEFGENTNKCNGQSIRGRNCTMECDQSVEQLRNMTKDQTKGKECDQGGEQLRNMAKDQTKGKECDQGGDQLRNMAKDQTKGKECDHGGEQLRNITAMHARLKDGSKGNCPVK